MGDAAATAAGAAEDGEAPPQESPRPKPTTGPISLAPLALDDRVSGDGLFVQLAEAVLGLVPEPIIPEEPPLPPPTFTQVLSRPPARRPRAEQKGFEILTLQAIEGEAGEEQEAEAAEAPPPNSQTRWVLEPRGQQRLLLKFFSDEIGKVSTSLTFEVVGGIGGNAPISIFASGETAYPSISSDPRNVFMKRAKAKPASGYASKQYIANLDVFDFGPLLAGRDPALRSPEPKEDGSPASPDQFVGKHMEALRITNSGPFKAKVSFQLASATPKEGQASELQ